MKTQDFCSVRLSADACRFRRDVLVKGARKIRKASENVSGTGSIEIRNFGNVVDLR